MGGALLHQQQREIRRRLHDPLLRQRRHAARDATHFHLDTLSDLKKLAGAAKDKSTGNLKVAIASDEEPDDDSLGYEGTVIDEEGDKWLRISQSYEEPGGLEDGIRNAESLRLKFGNSKFWSFNLKGSNAARKKLDECFDKFSN